MGASAPARSGPETVEPTEESWGATLAQLDAPFDSALARLPDADPVVVLFSGGLDSGVLAWELRERAGTKLTTFGLTESADVAAARQGAERIQLPWFASTASPEEVERMSRIVEAWVGPLTSTERSIETAFALATERAPPGTLVCGQGVDELFFGYAHFRTLAVDDAIRRGETDLASLLGRGWPREQEVARRLGRSVHAPFLDRDFLRAARSIPSEDRLAGDPPKAMFRAWARHRGVPEEIVRRPKKAIQYGSGVDRLLRRRSPKP